MTGPIRTRLVRTFESGERVFEVLVRDQRIGFYVEPEEVYVSVRDPYMAEKLELISPQVREYLVRQMGVTPRREDKLKKGIAVSYVLRLLKLAGLERVVIDGVEHRLPSWERVKILNDYFYVPKCQKYVAGVEYRCPRCCGWLTKVFAEALVGVPEELIARLSDDVKRKLGVIVVRLPETSRELKVYYAMTHPCPFANLNDMTCTLPPEVRPIKCWFYPSTVARITNGTLILTRNPNACRRKTKLKFAVEPQAPLPLMNEVGERVKVDLDTELLFWQRLKELTGSEKVDIIMDVIRQRYGRA